MGEYAKRLSDGAEIKIGTCESMYYCRWDQRKQIQYPYMTTGLYWRLPLPEEDNIRPGDFESHKILTYSELTKTQHIPFDAMINLDAINEEDREQLAKCGGIVQATVDILGMVINVPCYHGLKLPESADEGVKFFWNGKRDALYFESLCNREKELTISFACASCGKSWSVNYTDAEPLFRSMRMKLRLLQQCTEYWYEHNEGTCPYVARAMDANKRELTLSTWAADCYVVCADGKECYAGAWEGARNNFINLLPDREHLDKNGDGYAYDTAWNRLCYQGDELKENFLKAA